MFYCASEHGGGVSTRQICMVAVCVLLMAVVRRLLRNFSNEIPSARVGVFGGLGNIQAYSRDPVEYVRTATKRYGALFAVHQILTDTIWLRGGKMNKIYLDTKEVCVPLESVQRQNVDRQIVAGGVVVRRRNGWCPPHFHFATTQGDNHRHAER